MGSISFHRSGIWWVAALVAVAGAALTARLVFLSTEPYWLDETYTRDFNTHELPGLLSVYAQDIHPPLYGVLLHGWSSAVGESEEALRAYSSVWSVVGLLMAALLTRDITGSRLAAVLTALLLAVNPLDIWYGREARMYAQAAALMTLASWLLWRWVQREEVSRWSRWRRATAFGALSASLVYTHYVSVIVVVCQVAVVLALFALRRRWRDASALLVAAVAAAAAVVPWLLFVRRFRSGLYSPLHLGWIQEPSLTNVLSYLNHEFFLGFGTAPSAVKGWFSVVAAGVLGIVVLAAASVGPEAPAESSRTRREALGFLLGLALGPALLAAAISALWHPVYHPPRFSVFCLAPTVVAVVVLLIRVPPPLRTALLAAGAALMPAGAGWQAGAPIKWGLRELGRLGEVYGEPDFVIMLPALPDVMPRYYLPHAVVQPSKESLQTRLRSGDPATVWVCLRGGTMPAKGTPDGDFARWLTTTGPYHLLGSPDGMKVYELRAGQLESTTMATTPAPR